MVQEEVYFDELPLNDDVLDGVEAMGFEKATPIQAQSIPPVVEGRDVIGIAQTGTGKTAAFLIPTMHRLLEMKDRKGVGALIIVPTRELAVQIDQAVEGLSYFTGLSSMAIYGGGDAMEFSQEKKALQMGADIIIATPGRMLSHLNLGYVPVGELPILILDEADRMLDMGFYNDIMRIINKTSQNRQTLMFSATMPDKILFLTSQILKNPVTVNIALSKPAEGVEQGAYSLFNKQKIPVMQEILKGEDWKSVIVFASTKRAVSEINRNLKRKGINCAEISSDLEQKQREQVLLDFRNRKLTVLVATNVVSRGIDIDDIELVINYDVPQDAEDYVHRIGRTARASRTGKALTLISPDEQVKFFRIEQLIGSTVPKLKAETDVGDVPAYDPKPSRGGGKNRKGKGKGRGKPGGNRRHQKKRPPRKGGGQSKPKNG
ncbi:DEAD/DEAH box helicase [Sanyastnella coralliicola]|uniref:DEAD/DEAH box helicase n=1 Tax=Sanyastnella coralliicola TaxID=3069118 RepID=UPI0027B98760|nr:DEAD/DEAH box helicase [Longitalea sp. SCSIO 12813]